MVVHIGEVAVLRRYQHSVVRRAGSPRSRLELGTSSGLRNTEVFGFVVDQSKIRIVSAEEGLGRLEIPPWPEMMKAYNAALPKDDPRRYDESKRFKRDYKRAQQAIIHTEHGLPGKPGEPKTARERGEWLRRLRERFAAREPAQLGKNDTQATVDAATVHQPE